MHVLDDTIAAISTAKAEAAIGVIRLSGPDALKIGSALCRMNLNAKPKRKQILSKLFSQSDDILDEALVCYFKGPQSYTRQDIFEIYCHGSMFIQKQILEELLELGARMAEPGEFTMRAYLNGAMDLSQAEAVADLISARSSGAHQLAINQMRGGYSDEMRGLRQSLLDFASLMELEIDFGEEDVEFANRDDLRKQLNQIIVRIDELIGSFRLGNVLKTGIPVAIFGRPNAGKSSLLNALLNEDRAIVSDIAGTTRDTVEESLIINGIEFRLIDTAGLRQSEDEIEQLGIERTQKMVEKAEIALYVFDINETDQIGLKADMEKWMPQDIEKYILVANKMDLNPYLDAGKYFGEGDEELKTHWLPISALNDMNVSYLKQRIYELFALNKQKDNEVIVSNVRHFEALSAAKFELEKALTGLSDGLSSDLVALNLRYGISELGKILGEISNNELLGNIFGRFCIGK